MLVDFKYKINFYTLRVSIKKREMALKVQKYLGRMGLIIIINNAKLSSAARERMRL